MPDEFLMVFCPSARCCGNTFEYGDDGRCPGCAQYGLDPATNERPTD